MRHMPAKLQHHADKLAQTPWHRGVAFVVFDRETGREYHLGAGAMDTRTPYFATGTTKLAITAILLQLMEENRLSLNDPFQTHLVDAKALRELHVMDGEDHTDKISIRDLMAQRSGFGDNFLFKQQARSVQHDLADGVDSAWTFEDVIERTRSRGAISRPGTSKRAHYADTNYHLLGHMIEQIEGQSLNEVIQTRIVDRLGLGSTYLFCDPSDTRPINLMSRDMAIKVPRAMASFQADGGLVTNARDAMMFLRGFFEGYLFDRRVLPRLYDWHPSFYPVEYGVGLMQLQVPRWMSLRYRSKFELNTYFRKPPRLWGQLGLGGVASFYAPDQGVYVTGTVNQISDPARAIALCLHVVEALRGSRAWRHYATQSSGDPTRTDPASTDRDLATSIFTSAN